MSEKWRVPLPPGAKPPLRVFVNAVPQEEGRDYTLGDGELCVNDLAAHIGMTESAVSHQLRLLRTMRLVRVRREGRLAFYAVDDHHILELLKQVGTHVQEGA